MTHSKFKNCIKHVVVWTLLLASAAICFAINTGNTTMQKVVPGLSHALTFSIPIVCTLQRPDRCTAKSNVPLVLFMLQTTNLEILRFSKLVRFVVTLPAGMQ